MKKESVAIAGMLFILLFLNVLSAADDRSPSSAAAIFPTAKNIPAFTLKQWENIAAEGQFPMPKRDWETVGLPGGLDAQVWSAWAPDAKRVWRAVGPGYMNVIYDAKVDNGVISFVVDLGGLVQSKDGGRSWRPVSHHMTGNRQYYTFDISPADPNIMAVGGVHIDHTLNGGRSWAPVLDEALPPFKALIVRSGAPAGVLAYGRIRFNADGSRVFACPGAFGHGLGERHGIEREMASRLEKKIIYIGNGQVSNFHAIHLGPFAGIRWIQPHSSNPDLIYASFSDGTIYACRNARVAAPFFTRLETPESIKGFQAIGIDISPNDPNQLLLSMIDQHSNKDNAPANLGSKLVHAIVKGNSLTCNDVASLAGRVYTAVWDPHHPQTVLAGGWVGRGINASEDGMKTFSLRPFPDKLFPPAHITGWEYPKKILFDRKSDLVIAFSVTGAWSSRNQFKTAENLVMVDDLENKCHGNKGASYPECVESICIRRENTYIATTDHGAFRSLGKDTTRWRKISDNPGMPVSDKYRMASPIGVSEDESIIYLGADINNWRSGGKLLMVSRDKGETWQDITERLGAGKILGNISWIIFDQKTSKNQWIFMESKVFCSLDGGETFKTVSLPGGPLDTTFDSTHKVLYAAFSKGIIRSSDLGITWGKLPLVIKPYAISVLSNGDLVVSDDGRLMVIPYDKIENGKIEQSMIRLTIGETIPEVAGSLRTFSPIVCDGMEILAIPNNGWNNNTSARELGPLLSLNGGKSFQWISFDLPVNPSVVGWPDPIMLRDGKIMLGTRGFFESDYGTLGVK